MLGPDGGDLASINHKVAEDMQARLAMVDISKILASAFGLGICLE